MRSDVPDAGPKTEPAIRLAKLIPLLLVVLGILCYFGSLPNGFIFDDMFVLPLNPAIRSLTSEFMARGVVDFTFKLNYAFGGLNPADYRLVNIAFHILSGLFLFGIVRRTLMLPRYAKQFGDSAAFIAGAATAMWIVHPIQTESVTYICQRYEVLMGMFYLMTLYFFARSMTSAVPTRWLAASVISCIVGMGTKQVMVTAPVMVLLYDLVFAESARPIRFRWFFHVALFLSCGILFLPLQQSLVAHVAAQGDSTSASIGFLPYLLSQPGVFLHYLRLTFWPTGLCLDYGWQPVGSIGQALPAMVPIVIMGIATLVGLIRRSWLGYCGAWFFIILAPSSSIVPLPDLMFEHRMYLSLAAPVVATVVLVAMFARFVIVSGRVREQVTRAAVTCLAAVSIGLLAAVTIDRNKDYLSSETMWRDTINKRPWNLRPRLSMVMRLNSAGRFPEARAEANDLVKTMDEIESGRAPVTLATGRVGYYRARTYGELGHSLLCLGEKEESLRFYRTAKRIMPEDPDLGLGLAVALRSLSLNEDAEKELLHVIDKNPLHIQSLTYLGDIRAEEGRHAEAVALYRKVLNREPDHLQAQIGLAWLLSASDVENLRDSAEALSMARKACDATGYLSPRALGVLAAALAEAGDFVGAVKFESNAIGLLKPVEQGIGLIDGSAEETAKVSGEMKARLALYEQGKPYRIAHR